MTVIRIALEDTSGTRDPITIHIDSMTAVNILNNGKLDLKNLLVTRIPILILYTCTYSAYVLHKICYTGVTCIMQYISKSKLLESGFIYVLFTISVKFLINLLPTCILGLIGVLTFCSVKYFVGIHCYSYAVVFYTCTLN